MPLVIRHHHLRHRLVPLVRPLHTRQSPSPADTLRWRGCRRAGSGGSVDPPRTVASLCSGVEAERHNPESVAGSQFFLAFDLGPLCVLGCCFLPAFLLRLWQDESAASAHSFGDEVVAYLAIVGVSCGCRSRGSGGYEGGGGAACPCDGDGDGVGACRAGVCRGGGLMGLHWLRRRWRRKGTRRRRRWRWRWRCRRGWREEAPFVVQYVEAVKLYVGDEAQVDEGAQASDEVQEEASAHLFHAAEEGSQLSHVEDGAHADRVEEETHEDSEIHFEAVAQAGDCVHVESAEAVVYEFGGAETDVALGAEVTCQACIPIRDSIAAGREDKASFMIVSSSSASGGTTTSPISGIIGRRQTHGIGMPDVNVRSPWRRSSAWERWGCVWFVSDKGSGWSATRLSDVNFGPPRRRFLA